MLGTSVRCVGRWALYEHIVCTIVCLYLCMLGEGGRGWACVGGWFHSPGYSVLPTFSIPVLYSSTPSHTHTHAHTHRTIAPCKTSLPSWVWTSCQRTTSSLWPEPGRYRSSSPSHSKWQRSSPAKRENWCH